MRRPTALRIESTAKIDELQKVCGIAVRAGFDGIEWSIPDEDLALISTGQMNQLFDSLTDLHGQGIEVIAIASHVGSMDLKQTAMGVATALDRCGAIGARCLNLSIHPVTPSPGHNGFVRYSEVLDFAYRLLRCVRFDAESAGVAVALEAVCGGAFLSPVEARELVDSVNSWAIGMCVDVGRVLAVGWPVDWIETLGSRVHSVRLEPDWPLSGSGPSVPVDVAALGHALGRVPYERPLIAAGKGDPITQRKNLAGLGCPLEAA